MNRTILTLVCLLASTGVLMGQPDRLNEHYASRSEVIAARGMVATSQPLAAQAGLEILKRGGNAMDAAIATNAAMGLMEPTGNGIGGDLYALIWHQASGRVYALNASGRSPGGLSFDRLLEELEQMDEDRIPPSSLLSVSVPGAVDGWFEIHDRFGQLPMSEILQPAIDYAENGFPVSEVIADAWQRSVPVLSERAGAFIETFTIDGRAPQKGELFRNADLAHTYRLLATRGRDAFYRGEIARSIDAFMREHGGYLRFEDFDAHTSEWHEPLSTDYRGYRVYQIGQNNQGTAVLQMLNILERYDLASMGHNSAEALHLMIEAKKLAYEDRAKYYADPDFADLPFETLVSKEYADQRAQLITDRALDRIDTGVPGLREGGTIYLATADSEGNMVSLIQSNFRGMGTGFVVPGTGFSFQNRGELFSLDPRHPNVYAPGKRPFHTIIPGFVTREGQGWFALGVMGGEFQPIGHVQILTNIIDFGMNVQEAGDALRWLHTRSTEPTDSVDDLLEDGGLVRVESRMDAQVVEALRSMGHEVRVGGGFYGRYQGIKRDFMHDVYIGGSESRADGQVVGY